MEEVGQWGHIFGDYLFPFLSLSLSLLPSYHELIGFASPHALCHDPLLPHHSEIIEPADHGLKPLKQQAKINPPSFKSVFLRHLSS
jgi:hypothetical protein